MNHILKTSIASLFAVSMLAGTAFAQSDPATDGKARTPSMDEKQTIVDQSTTGSVVGGNFMTMDSIGTWQSGDIKIVQVSNLNDTDPNKVMLQDRMKANPDDVSALQSAIDENAELKAQLLSQNVQLSNVVAAEKATDGSVTFYVQ